MTTTDVQIVIIEPSQIIYQGLFAMITDSGRNFQMVRADDLTELQHHLTRSQFDAVILNPSLVQAEMKTFQGIRNEYPRVKCIGLVYSFFDQQILTQFDGIISINDSPHKIFSTIQQVIQTQKSFESETVQESLSDRETDVLKLLVTGLANKVIADKLNISPYTVITHRKNISQKTGIKSVSGLTIYAVVKGIISIDDFSR
jgi:DNA-binding NarL/FixJ family response regulator